MANSANRKFDFTWQLNMPVIVRLLKVAIASGLSYAIATTLVGNNRGYFAPLASVLIMQGSVAESFSRAIQRILGVIFGVIVALAFAHFAGLNTFSIALLVFLSLAVGIQLKLGSSGTPQVAVSALLIMIIGSLTPGYWWERIYETVIGAVLGAVIHAFILPPSYLPEAQAAIDHFATQLSQLLYAFADYFNEAAANTTDTRFLLQQSRKTNNMAKDVRTAVTRAQDSLRWNITRQQLFDQLRYWMMTAEILERVSVTSRVIARLLDDLQTAMPDGHLLLKTPDLQQQLTRLFSLSAQYLQALTLADTDSRDQELKQLMQRFDQALQHYEQTVGRFTSEARMQPRGDFLPIHSVLANLHVLMHDIYTHHVRVLHPADVT